MPIIFRSVTDSLTDAGADPKLAEAITAAIHRAGRRATQLDITRSLTDAGADPKLAEAITVAIDHAVESLATRFEVDDLRHDYSTLWGWHVEPAKNAAELAKQSADRAERLSVRATDALSDVDRRLARLEGIITGRRDRDTTTDCPR